jgi:muramoyltetrapeptide carboxypeptidase
MISPPNLKKGDKIAIAAPARKISINELKGAFEIIKSYGLEVVFNDNLYSSDNQFAGNDDLRAIEIQSYINDESIKAILFARGGYGSVRIIDKIDFATLQKSPKWIAGYSDVTVFLNDIYNNYGIETLHSSMPINFTENSNESIKRLFDVLEGKRNGYEVKRHFLNKFGQASGNLVGGNLSVLYSILCSNSFPDTDKTILFLEDLDEYLYHIDRMMIALKRAGKFENLGGMIIGAMTDMNDNNVPFGKNAEEIIADIVSEYNFPVCFGFQAGHINNNLPLVIGAKIDLVVDSDISIIKYI